MVPWQRKPCCRCSLRMMTRCVRPRAGAGWPLALPMIPYLRANLAGKQRALSTLDPVEMNSACSRVM